MEKREIERFFIKEVIKELNVAFELSPTAQLATGVLLHLPIQFNLVKVNEPVKYNGLDSGAFMAYTKLGNDINVYFDFLYNNETDYKKIKRYIEKHKEFWAYVYLHETMHILYKHNTNAENKRMHKIILKEARELGFEQRQVLKNMADDYMINYIIKDTFSSYGVNLLIKYGLYSTKYHNRRLHNTDILIDLLKNKGKIKTMKIYNNFVQVEHNNKKITMNIEDKERSGNDEKSVIKKQLEKEAIDKQIEALGNNLKNTITEQAKGSGIMKKFEQFTSIKTETGWFTKFKKKYEKDVFYKTNLFFRKWNNLHNTYRHIAPFPKTYYKDNKLNIILSIDQSGSMNKRDLQKLLYVIENNSKNIEKLTVLIHDYEISKVFELDAKNTTIDKNLNFKKALATRWLGGGTSHKDVFEWVNKNVKPKDIDKTILIVFSDMYSDIEEEISKYTIIKKLAPYWVTTDRKVTVPGTLVEIK